MAQVEDIDSIVILDGETLTPIGTIIDPEEPYIHERINDKYTFDFTCYEQEATELLNGINLINVDDDYFRIAQVRMQPVLRRIEVSCEHVSYELNVVEEGDEPQDDLIYSGSVRHVIEEMLQGTRFTFKPSDDLPNIREFKTKTAGIRSRIIEFCKTFGFEVNWNKFEVAIQKRRGHDYGLTIELGKNLKDVTITRTYEFDGSVTDSYDIDFIDLNKIVDENGNPLEQYEFHMGDTVYLKIGDKITSQRGIAVGYNPFRRELPNIELSNPVHSFTEVIAGGIEGTSLNSNYRLEFASCPLANEMTYDFEYTEGYDDIKSIVDGIICETSVITPINISWNPVRDEVSGKYKSVIGSVSGTLPVGKVSIQVIGFIGGGSANV